MHSITDLIIPLGFFAMAFGIVYVSVRAHHNSKMAMIEAGIDPRDADERSERDPMSTLKRAILFIMVPIGILVGRWAAPTFDLAPVHGSIVFAFLFGGLGFGIFYLIQLRKEGNSNS